VSCEVKGSTDPVLTLNIENVDQLPDGGPTQFQVDRRGFDIGRAQHLDWTLPDPTRIISSKHCEVRYLDGAYWLYDLSTNGTFVNRSSRRVQSPYRLCHGDQLEIGEYIVSVSIQGEDIAEEPRPEETRDPASHGSDDLWGVPGEPSPPVDVRDLVSPAEKRPSRADFLHQVVDVAIRAEHRAPRAPPPPDASSPAGHRSVRDPWAPTDMERATPPVPQPGQAPPFIGAELPFSSDQPRRPTGQPAAAGGHQAAQPLQQAGPAAGLSQRDLAHEFLLRFARGANVPPESLAGHDAGQFAEELGMLMRLVCGHLMQLLSARAAAKTLARSPNRTMIQHADNNPLKFMPAAEDALRVMFSASPTSYLDARGALQSSFDDLQTHQMATYGAMQQAIRELLDDLGPEAIEDSAQGSKTPLLGSSKAKLWETYAARWEAKSARYENGMIDAFLMYFAEFYDQYSRQTGAPDKGSDKL
jgi:type VI secretion system protein ImpI